MTVSVTIKHEKRTEVGGLQGEPWLVGTEFFQLERSGALF